MTKASQLSSELAKALMEYTEETKKELFEKIDEAAVEGKKAVQSSLSKGHGVGRRGKYKKSIKTKKTYETKYNMQKVIYADSTEYRLTHLLENGHLTRDGKKRTGQVEHWKYGQEVIEKVMK